MSHPSLYGWNWDYALLAGFSAAENLPAAETTSLLDHDPVVAHWAGVYFESAEPGRPGRPRPGHQRRVPPVEPALLVRARACTQPSQVVLGPATLAALHAHVGGTVVARRGRAPMAACASSGPPPCPPSAARANP